MGEIKYVVKYIWQICKFIRNEKNVVDLRENSKRENFMSCKGSVINDFLDFSKYAVVNTGKMRPYGGNHCYEFEPDNAGLSWVRWQKN